MRIDKTPRQDLRPILKTGESGMQTSNMNLPAQKDAAAVVNYSRDGTIKEDSLWPVRYPQIKVRTKWRNMYWIERKLVDFEILLAMDVSEKLIRATPDGVDRKLLVKGVHVPGKILYGVLNHLHKLANRTDGHGSRKRERSVEMLDAKRRKLNRVESYSKPSNHSPQKADVMLDTVVGTSNQPKSRKWMTSLAAIPEEVAICESINIAVTHEELGHNDKATKSDSAGIRCGLWDQYLMSGLFVDVDQEVLENAICVISKWLREWLLRRWKVNVTRSYVHWSREAGVTDHEDARDCIIRASNATWWAWDVGSRPFFWRWPDEYLAASRHGVQVWFDGMVSPWTKKQRRMPDENRSRLINEKLQTVRNKNYVEKGHVISLMSYFDVPKGSDDIRMVYDGTASGLNDKLWAPWFSLPNCACLVRSLDSGYWMADNDVGEMFHNFMLHDKLRRYCGLDFTPFFESERELFDDRGRYWLRWNRLAMGLRPSPYCAVQGMMMAREVILGNRHNQTSNVFHWHAIRLNLPGDVNYTPSKAWVTKVRENGQVAADVFIYVDDIRCSAPTQVEAWQASQRTSSILGWLGLQDAARKRRDPGQETGAWTGSVVWTSHGKIIIKTTQDKWDKVKLHLQWIVENMENRDGLDNRKLQSIRGFLVYVAQTYGSLVPYLKGLHATIDSWRRGRTASGWKISRSKVGNTEIRDNRGEFYDWDDRFGLTQLSDEEPARVFPVPRFRNDVKCLLVLTAGDNPPEKIGRMSMQAKVMYGFGDASKHGFGASIELPDKSIMWRFGQWRLEEEHERLNPGGGLSFMEERSSNYRELRNLVEALESAHEDGMLTDREIFMFTDNSTAESAFFKGTSSSELLFDLVLRLRKIEMCGDCLIHMIHVAGTRMIHQGTDGLSRGDKTSGVMAGDSMLSFVPLHLSSLDRSPPIREWIESLFESGENSIGQVHFLRPTDWPEPHLNGGNYIWSPAPAAGDVAAEYMAQSIHKRSSSTHIYICPRLMTSRWQRIVRKASDLFLTIPIGSPIWNNDQHEPLILAISFPLSRDRPWKHGGTPRCDHYGKILSDLFKEDINGAVVVLRECFAHAWGLAKM